MADFNTVLEFGGGVHSRASESDIDPKECTSGENFDLDPQNRDFKNRQPFDLIGTVPNGLEIRGFANLQKSDGSISLLVQAGGTVYEWDGSSTFTSVGTVVPTAKLRGKLEHNWQLDDKVIITDLNLQQPVMEWDGTTLQNVSFTTEDGSTPFGTFKARYCAVSEERVIFANVNDNGTDTPHLIVGSQRGSYTIITVANRPSSALSEEDPFYLIQPDYRYINGMTQGFHQLITSSKSGSLFNLSGSSAKDFAFNEFFARSGASGDESVTNVGNDITYGRNGRLESVIATDKFGDVDGNDLSSDIYNLVENYKEWTVVYNQRNQRIYCLPTGESQIWVYHKPLVGSNLSPWSKWTTVHSSAFNPTVIMNMLDPADGLEYVYFGDSNGNFYRLEGQTNEGDGGANNVKAKRRSGLIQAPSDLMVNNIEGWIKYRSGDSATVTITIYYRGMNVYNETITVSIPVVTNRKVYGGGSYYNSGEGYGSFSGRLYRQIIGIAGQSNEFQVEIEVDGKTNFQISEIGLNFKGS